MNTPRYITDDMNKHIFLAFSSIKNNMINYWKDHDITDYIDIKDDEIYTVNDMEIIFDYTIKNNNLIITAVNDDTTGAYILYKENEYIFELKPEYISKFEDGADISSVDTYEELSNILNNNCISIKYDNEYHTYDSIKQKRKNLFDIACALTIVGKYAFKEQVNYFNGKNMIKYI